MWNFEGDFRTRPTQSLRGASRKEPKEVLLKRAQEERRKRENQRIRDASAKKIQSVYRGYRARCKQYACLRNEFDILLLEATKKSQLDLAMLSNLIRRLVLFFRPQVDGQRLISACQHILKQKEEYLMWIFKDAPRATLQIKHLLEMNLRYLGSIAQTSLPIAVPMRMLEVFISPSLYANISLPHNHTSDEVVCQLLKQLIKNDYFERMKELLNQKVPSGLEKSPVPPTPVAGSILDLIMSPISFATATADKAFSRQVLLAVCRTFLCPSFSEQVAQFLLPAMAYGKYPFPFVELIQALITHASQSHSSADMSFSTASRSASSSYISSNANAVMPSPWLLLSILTLGQNKLEHLNSVGCTAYLEVLRMLMPYLTIPKEPDLDDSDDEDEHMVVEKGETFQSLGDLRDDCLHFLDSPDHLNCMLIALNAGDRETIECVAGICHVLLSQQYIGIHRLRSSTPLLNMLSSGLPMAERDIQRIVPLLSTFCSMFSYSLLTLHDADFYGDNDEPSSSMPFTLREMVPMSLALRNACLGIIELAHPDAKFAVNEDYRQALHLTGIQSRHITDEDDENETRFWAYLFKAISTLVRQIHSRDSRRPFCRQDHWLASQVSIQADKPSQIYKARNSIFIRRPFASLRPLTKMNIDDERPPLANREVRNLIILTELPFVVSFEERVKILQRLIQGEKEEHQGEMHNFMMGPTISVMIRRNYIYEDAFEKLSRENEPNLKLKMRVQLVNIAGMDEAGIDGGGIFREFLLELLKTGFDPNRGFFMYTADRLLYPNPQASVLMPNFTEHFFFLGRMLGKALLENMLVELPFASFFLAKILSHSSANLDIHHLQSLDPIMYKNLLYLKNYEGDVADLGLDFTVVSNDFGETKVEELKAGGRQIAVTRENRIEYVHLMADYRLNKQIRQHCAHFRQGMADVIKLDWLQMFSSQELQVLISGASIPIDIFDLRQHTNYSGGYRDDHPEIVMFWEVVSQFTDKQKRQLLKFVTSCSRPPLLGFKDLYPAFCIHNAGNEQDRLPTSSTCMNLLKLPEFNDQNILRTKLLYAIEADAGFELS
ncbi:ubiquitin-protein ligase E3C-like isoform X2 [Pomacea canaliculata]|uniref:ubiquitin-protein ligase E3C-like isoform X2 n=1 Tax=Pomacea canaliculata TaxID=400727 RepID=UPI000D73D54E|nr:ubiquitin-protein ligase E3C-like isoform X2 [Pomacea canaliculata]